MADEQNKIKRTTGGIPVAMNNPNKIIPAESEAYPKTTNGSKIAAQVRKKANGWTDAKRKELFDRGMQIIYGGSGNCSAKVRS